MRARILIAALALGIPAGVAAAAHAVPKCVAVQQLPAVVPSGTSVTVCFP